MSLAQFDDVFEICCELMALEEKKKADMVKNGGGEVRDVRRTVGYEWWEIAIEEIEKEKEREILNV